MILKKTVDDLIRKATVAFNITAENAVKQLPLLEQACDCYHELITVMNQASEDYYSGKPSGILDSDFDRMMDLLRSFESKNIVIVHPNSPTLKVNSEKLTTPKVSHLAPMLSLRDLFSMEDLRDWVSSRKTQWCVEPKIDGLSVELVYDGGRLTGASTRGDGYSGEDVTQVVSRMRGVPKEIAWKGLLAVRGEIYMTKADFESYKQQFGKAANARNLSVGLLKRKSDFETGAKYLSVLIFNLQMYQSEDVLSVIELNLNGQEIFDLSSHTEQLRFLSRLGFPVIPSRHCMDWGFETDRVEEEVNRILDLRPILDYNIDGAVIKADSIEYRKSVGDDGAVPRWAVAYKYPAVEGQTQVRYIDFQLGKTGKITPVAILEPVEIDGSTISRCTLHNKNRMLDLDIRAGDEVKIHKSGDVIPKITEAIHTEESLPFFYPETCPVCGHTLDGEYCRNSSCPNKTQAKLYNWVDKGGLDAPGVSGSLVSALIERKMISTPADFYKLTPADLYKLPKMGPTKVTKTLRAIDETRKRPFARVIVGLCIDNVGGAAATKLATYAGNWDSLMSMTLWECRQVVGDSVGRSFYAAIQEPYYRNLVEELKSIFPFNN